MAGMLTTLKTIATQRGIPHHNLAAGILTGGIPNELTDLPIRITPNPDGTTTITPKKSWAWILHAQLPDTLTMREIRDITGLSRSAIKAKLNTIHPLPQFGAHGALSYPTSVIVAMVKRMPARWPSMRPHKGGN